METDARLYNAGVLHGFQVYLHEDLTSWFKPPAIVGRLSAYSWDGPWERGALHGMALAARHQLAMQRLVVGMMA